MNSKHRPFPPAFLCAIIVLAVCFSAPAAFAEINYVKTTVTDESLQKYAINDRGEVAWVGQDDGVPQVFLYSKGKNTQITANTGTKFILQIQLNNQGQIAWSQQDYDETGNDSNINIYLYDGSDYRQLNDNHGEWGWQSLAPSLNNTGMVAWIQSYLGANDWQVVIFTGSGSPTQLSDGIGRNWPPRLNDAGWVTWSGDRRTLDDWDTRVYLYNGIATQVIAYVPGQGCSDPQINNQGQVAWENYNSPATPSYNIYLWDGTNTQITNVGTTNYNFAKPFVLNNAGQIAWTWGPSMSPKQVYLAGGGAINQLTNDAYDHNDIRLRENGWLAWTQYDGGYRTDICVYRNGGATGIDQYVALPPQLNSRGQVVWANGYPISLASPVLGSPAVNLLLMD